MDKRKTTNKIYIHHTVTSRYKTTRDQISHLHTDPPPRGRGWSDIGYHYLIMGDGRIVPGRDESLVGAHCLGHNRESIGVSCTGSFVKGGDVMVYGDAQYNVLCDLVAQMVSKYKIPLSRILGHRDGQATECPGQIYSLMAAIRNSVELRLRQPESAPAESAIP